MHLDMDLETQTVTASTPDGLLPVVARLLAYGDGDYTAQLSLWDKQLVQRGWSTPFIPLFTSQVRDGHITRVVPADTRLAVISLLPPDDPPMSAEGQANIATVASNVFERFAAGEALL
jgi:hypothetical protein